MPDGWLLGAVVVMGLGAIWLWGHLLLRRRVLTTRECPRCGQTDWHRRHRHLADHIFGLGLNVRRYRCGNTECNWDGLRRRSHL